MARRLTSIPNIIAFFLGISISGLILGRSVFGVFFGIAVLLILIDTPFSNIKREFKKVYKSNLALLLLAVFLASLPSLITSDFTRQSCVALLRTFVFCNLGVLIWVYLKDRPALANIWMKSFIISAAISILFALYSQHISPALYWFLHLKGWKTEYLKFTLKGFSSTTVLVIPLLYIFSLRQKVMYRVIGFLAGFCFCFLVWDVSNRATVAGLLGIVITIAVALCIRFASRLQVLVTMAFTLTSTGLVMVWLHITRRHMVAVAPDGNYFLPLWLIDFQRQTIWNNALEIGLRTPWFGRGPNTINFAQGADKPLAGSAGLHAIPAHPHNWIVELFAEVGAICLTLLVIFLVFKALTLLRRYRISADPAYLSAIAIFAGYWVSGLFNFSFWSSWWQLSFILSLALSLALRQDLIADDKSSGHRPKPSE